MRSKTVYIFIVTLVVFVLVLTGCNSSTNNDVVEKQAFDAYKDILIPMAQEKVDAGELTARQADYIIYLSRQGKYPRGSSPGFGDALDDPPEVPEDWDGPKEVKDNKVAEQPAEKPAFDAYKDVLIPMAQEKVDAGELTARQADYIIYLSRQGQYPRGATPSFSDALDNPPEVPEDWDGPKEVKQ